MISLAFRILQTVACFGALFIAGASLLLVPPTLVHLELLFSQPLSLVALALLTRQLGNLVGCLLCGYWFDRLGRRELQLVAVCVLRLITLTLAPWFHSAAGFAACLGVYGLCHGYTDAGLLPYFLAVWQGHKLQGAMTQLIGMGWTVGAAVSPLVVRCFLVPLSSHPSITNSSTDDVIYIPNDAQHTAAVDLEQYSNNSSGFSRPIYNELVKQMSSVYRITANTSLDLQLGLRDINNTLQNVNFSSADVVDVSLVQYAYLTVIPPYLLVIGLFVIIDWHWRSGDSEYSWRRSPPNAIADSKLTVSDDLNCRDCNENVTCAEHPSSNGQNTWHGRWRGHLAFFVCNITFTFLISLSEAILLNVLTLAAVRAWRWDPRTAAFISTVILAGNNVGKVIVIVASIYIRPFVALTSNLIAYVIGYCLLLACQHVTMGEYAYWLAFVAMGLGGSTIQSSNALYLNDNLPITGRISSAITFVTCVAWIVGPYFGALLLDNVGHMITIYASFVAILGAVVCLATLPCLARPLRSRCESTTSQNALVLAEKKGSL